MSAPADSRTGMLIKARAAQRVAIRPIATTSPARVRESGHIHERDPKATTEARPRPRDRSAGGRSPCGPHGRFREVRSVCTAESVPCAGLSGEGGSRHG